MVAGKINELFTDVGVSLMQQNTWTQHDTWTWSVSKERTNFMGPLPQRWWGRRHQPGWLQLWPPGSPHWHRETGGSWTAAQPHSPVGKPELWWRRGRCEERKHHGTSSELNAFPLDFYWNIYPLCHDCVLRRNSCLIWNIIQSLIDRSNTDDIIKWCVVSDVEIWQIQPVTKICPVD